MDDSIALHCFSMALEERAMTSGELTMLLITAINLAKEDVVYNNQAAL